MAAQRIHRRGRIRAVLLDAMGTLLTFEPPAPHLRTALRERLGAEVSEDAARAAIAAEIAYYRAHLHEGRDEAGLAALRRASAEVMRGPLGLEHADGELLTAALLDALRFHAFPEVPGALRTFRAAGARLVVVSNWDVSLHERLDETGLAPLLDGAVASAELGAAKPDPAIFARGLEIAGVQPAQALHVGDSPREDAEGALAAGIAPVLLARDGRADAPEGLRVIRALDELRVP
jgi:putative hydrolase of the HAD superfamily